MVTYIDPKKVQSTFYTGHCRQSYIPLAPTPINIDGTPTLPCRTRLYLHGNPVPRSGYCFTAFSFSNTESVIFARELFFHWFSRVEPFKSHLQIDDKGVFVDVNPNKTYISIAHMFLGFVKYHHRITKKIGKTPREWSYQNFVTALRMSNPTSGYGSRGAMLAKFLLMTNGLRVLDTGLKTSDEGRAYLPDPGRVFIIPKDVRITQKDKEFCSVRGIQIEREPKCKHTKKIRA